MVLKLSEMPEDQWVKQFSEGDEGAFGNLFQLLYPTLCFFARKIQPMPGVAEEIVQDALFRVWQRKADFDSFFALKSFLYISTKNACLDSLDQEDRKLKREQRYSSEQPELEKSVDEEIIYAEVLLEISQAIDQLPEQCRKIMKLLFEEGKKAKEIAGEMNISVSTVNNQKARGISLLKEKLGDDNFSLLFLLASIEMLSSL